LQIRDRVSKILIERLEKKAKNDKDKYLTGIKNYIKQLDKLKSKIYDKYSTDIMETNSLV
jgi:hypothetical protein